MTIPPPAPDSARLQAVLTALGARDARRAAEVAEPELSRGVEHPLLFTARGIWRAENGRHQEALADFRCATRLAPGNPSAWNAEGNCLIALGRHEEAVEALDKAIALRPNAVEVLVRKAWVLEQIPNPAAARATNLQVLALDPNNGQALGRLAFAAAQQGGWDEARTYAARALRTNPAHPTARYVVATADIETGAAERAEQPLLDLLNDKTISEADRALLLTALGDLRDKQGRPDDAFEAYSQANRRLQGLPGRVTTAGGLPMSEMVRLLTAYFERRTRQPRAPAHATECEKHVFLLGFLRSGTTLLEQVLASHPAVVTLEEKGPIAGAVQDYMPPPHRLDALYKATEQEIDGHRKRYWQSVRKHGIDPAGKVFVDKGPIYTVDLPVILRLFPDAKILFAVRDPRDVVLSCFRTHFELNSTTAEFLTLESTAAFYADVMQLAEIYRKVLPMDLHEVRHEAFVDDFESEARRLCAFLGLGWDETMRKFAERAKLGTIATASAAQIARGLNREGVGRWRPYARHLEPVMPRLQPWVERFGYPPS